MEILQFAIDMELDAERYYREQAAKNAQNPLRTVFEILADDEASHAGLLRSKRDGKPYELAARAEALTVRSVFSDAAGYEARVKELPDQPELYQAAQTVEQQSIDLYRDLLSKAVDERTAALFTFLVGEETEHLRILEEFYQHVNRPNAWVESAEFGVREEY